MTFDKVKEIIVENLGCDESEVTMDSHLMDDLGADSLDAVELSLALEDKLGVKIPDDEFEKMVRVKDIVNYIDQQ